MKNCISQIKNIPLSVPVISGNEWNYIKKCLDTGWVSSAGPFVSDFENTVSERMKVKSAIACVNGTSGLFIALKVCGVGNSDEVIVPVLTFIASVNVIRYLDAEPVFMDCDDYMNIDTAKLEEFCRKECLLTKKGLLKNKRSGRLIKAIMPVHIFGNPCDMEGIVAVAKKYNLKVIEDATESIGSYYTSGKFKGKFTGTIGDVGVFSFNGNKIITTGGGGMIVTNNRTIAKRAGYLTGQAKDDPVNYVHNEIGYNFRLSNIQAALGLAQFEQLEGFIKTKKKNYELYRKLLNGVNGIKIMDIPPGTAPNYWFYSLIIGKESSVDRERIMKSLEAKGVQSRPIWRLNHLQRPYRKNQSYKIKKAFWFWHRVLSLPCSVNLTSNEIEKLVSAIIELRG